jgi:hypothetical protein
VQTRLGAEKSNKRKKLNPIDFQRRNKKSDPSRVVFQQTMVRIIFSAISASVEFRSKIQGRMRRRFR